MQLVDDLELLAVRANGSTNGIRVLEPASASKGKQFVDKLCFGDSYSVISKVVLTFFLSRASVV